MARGYSSKSQRQKKLARYLANNPLLKDEDLAGVLGVSIQTIRLDRSELNIPELRERMKTALQGENAVKSLGTDELFGELLDIAVGNYGVSMLSISREMAFRRTSVARGHHLFAQANSLAVAIIDAEVALTGSARVLFKQPVKSGDKVVARAEIINHIGNKFKVKVISRVMEEVVFQAVFTVFALHEEEI